MGTGRGLSFAIATLVVMGASAPILAQEEAPDEAPVQVEVERADDADVQVEVEEPAPAAPEVEVTSPPARSEAEGEPEAGEDRPERGHAGPEEAPAGAETPGAEEGVPPPIAAYVQGEGFRILSPDGNFKLRVGMQGEYKIEPAFVNDEPQLRKAFYVMRPILSGHLFRDWIRFWFSMETAAAPPYLLDAYAEIQPVDWFGIRAGQQFSPIDRHEYLGPQEILFPDWNIVAEYFWPGRDKGVLLFGTFLEQKVEYYAGVFSGTPLRQFRAIPGNYVLKGRVTVSPFGPLGPTEFPYMFEEEGLPFRISFNAQAYGGVTEIAEQNLNPTSGLYEVQPTGGRRQQIGGGADVAMQWGPMAGLIQGYVRNTNLLDGTPAFTAAGAFGQLGVEVWPQKVDLAARLSWIEPSFDLTSDMLYAGELQASYYVVAPNVVVRLRYGLGYQEEPDPDDVGGAILWLPPGIINVVTLQLNLNF